MSTTWPWDRQTSGPAQPLIRIMGPLLIRLVGNYPVDQRAVRQASTLLLPDWK